MSKQKKGKEKKERADIKTRFQPGNQLWKLVDPKNLGNPRFETPIELWEQATGYFQFCDENPWEGLETKTTDSTDDYKEDIKTIWKRVPYTWEGLYIYINVCNLHKYKEKPDFANVLSRISDVIYQQKFTGASTGDFNANIIARDLGLKDTTNLNHGGQANNPIEIVKIQLPDNQRDNKESS